MKRVFTLSIALVLLPIAAATALQSDAHFAALLPLNIPINPIAVRYLETGLAKAAAQGAELAVVQVTPRGGDAASVSAAVAAIGRAKLPVVVQVVGKKVGADTPAGYLERASALPAGGSSNLSTLPVRSYALSPLAGVLSALLDPNIAYALLVLGILGIAFELSIPGVGLPGVVGGLSFLISLIALGMLSANLGGILIVMLGFVLFVLDIKAPTHGILTAGGLVALLAGSFLLFPSWQAASLPGLSPPRISTATILVSTGLLGALFATALSIGVRAQHTKVTVGAHTLVGLCATAVTELDPEGIVRVANEEWSARAVGDPVRVGEEADVLEVEGVHLVVMRRL